jgi:hypothetical protein
MKVILYLNTSIEKMNDISESKMKPNPIDQQTNGRHRESLLLRITAITFGIRILDHFSAMDKNIVETGEFAVFYV